MGNSAPAALPSILEADTLFTLSDSRVLAYRECGPADGFPTVVLHGAMGIGDFESFHADFERMGIRAISPTLPGWGQSSPKSKRTLAEWPADVAELLAHLGVTGKYDCIGISYGCVHALACAAHDAGRVRSVCILAPHGPFDDPAFNPLEGMTSISKFGLGGVANALPVLGRAAGNMVRSSTNTPEKSASFAHDNLISKLTPTETELLNALSPDAREKIISGQSIYASLVVSLDGYTELPAVLRSWSHRDLARITCPLFVAGGTLDDVAPLAGARYIVEHVPGAELHTMEGGHMSAVLRFAELVQLWVTMRDTRLQAAVTDENASAEAVAESS